MGIYIITTYEGTGITNYKKCMFFQTILRSKKPTAACINEGHLTFMACLQVGVKERAALCLNAEYYKAFDSMLKWRVADKSRKGKGHSKAHNDLGKGCGS